MDLLTVFFAAVLVEGIVNIVKSIKDKEKDWRYWASLAVGLLIGILVAYNWSLDLFSALLGEGEIPYVGAVLTGIVISRGSNYVSDLLKLINDARVKANI